MIEYEARWRCAESPTCEYDRMIHVVMPSTKSAKQKARKLTEAEHLKDKASIAHKETGYLEVYTDKLIVRLDND